MADTTKIAGLSAQMKRDVQQGIVSIHNLMARLLAEYGVDMRGASTVTLTVPHPRHNDGVIRLHGTSDGGGQVGDLTIPLKMIELSHGESWGLELPEKENSDEEEGGLRGGAIVC